jgi:hypothetical protein
MSEIRLNRTNLLNNDSLPHNKRFDRLSSGARRDYDRGVLGIDCDKAAQMLRDHEVERTKPDAGVIDPT